MIPEDCRVNIVDLRGANPMLRKFHHDASQKCLYFCNQFFTLDTIQAVSAALNPLSKGPKKENKGLLSNTCYDSLVTLMQLEM